MYKHRSNRAGVCALGAGGLLKARSVAKGWGAAVEKSEAEK